MVFLRHGRTSYTPSKTSGEEAGNSRCNTALTRDQADRDAIASQLLRHRDGRGDDWADIIDMLTMHPDARRKVVRLLGTLMCGGLG
jgi:hypothetical protein